ncbi:MAG: ankyrin repeat domain-containing protein [Betaproteobacteria bacterium]|nr:ankyrin repeat domain-containing protein [Betaproteobacteria bacterium]
MKQLRISGAYAIVYFMIAASIGLLTACENGRSADASSGAPNVAQTGSEKPCFRPVGKLDEKDNAIFTAVASGDILRLQEAIDAGGNVNAADLLKRTPLFAAAFCGQRRLADLLVEKGCLVDAKDFNGSSPLHSAVIMGSREVMETLLVKGANINIQDSVGYTPLHLAAATDQVDMVRTLIEHGANPQITAKNGLTPAALGARNSHPRAVAAIKRSQ